MERPTKTITTPVGNHQVVIREWLTGGDKRKLAAERDGDKRHTLLVASLVVSIDGKDNVMEIMDNMHGKDFDTVLLALTAIAEDSSLSDEKKST